MSGYGPNIPAGDYPAMSQRPGNGLAVAALVLGIISIALICVWYLAIPCGILAIIFGIVGRRKAREGASGGGLATAGMVCGLISICLFVLLFGLVCAGVTGLGLEAMDQFQKAAEEAARQAQESAATQSATP